MKILSRTLQVLTIFSLLASAANAEDTIRASMPENGVLRLEQAKSGSSSIELYERMSRLCEQNGGSAVYVIPREIGRYKRLVEADAAEAFSYIASRPGSDIAWYMACSGNVRFMVEKMLRSMNRGEDMAAFYLNRGLEGVNYIKDASAVSYANTAAVEKTPEQKEAFREQMAWEVSAVKKDFVKPEDTSRYIGFYNGNYEDTNCSRVSIKEMPRVEDAAVVVYDFKVCDRRVASLGQRVVEEKGAQSLYANFLARP